MELVAEQYKKSEVGLIPTDWDELTFKDICWVNQGLQIPISQRLILPNKNSKVYITIQYLNDGKTIEYIDDYVASVCCNKEDILMTRTGNTGIVVSGVEGVFHNNFFKINFDRDKFDKDYLVYYLNQSKTKKIILAKAGISTIPDLNHKDFYSIPIPLPPTKAEQTAIATTLSDADALINGLEKLITKKRNIKQGAMQKLLQPKEDWEVKKLGDFLDYEQPTEYLVSDTEYNDNNQTPVLTAGKTFILGYTNEEHGIFKNLPVIIFDDFTTAIKYVDFPFKAKSSAMKMLIPKNDKVNLRFVFEIMLQIKYQVADHKRHWIGEFSKLEITVPPTPEEQKKIATILSDMDAEITALQNKLEKYKKIKLGMMQNLLTGKIRLV
jgi:type I restriction enzyme, S subunit